MKYSQKQQDLHRQMVYEIIVKDPKMSSRGICYFLKNDKGLVLSRNYASRLMKEALERYSEMRRDRKEYNSELLEWSIEVDKAFKELEKTIDRMRFTFPGVPEDFDKP